jgi:hypothetical protein
MENNDNAICPITTYQYVTIYQINSTNNNHNNNTTNTTIYENNYYTLSCSPEDILVSPRSSCQVFCNLTSNETFRTQMVSE